MSLLIRPALGCPLCACPLCAFKACYVALEFLGARPPGVAHSAPLKLAQGVPAYPAISNPSSLSLEDIPGSGADLARASARLDKRRPRTCEHWGGLRIGPSGVRAPTCERLGGFPAKFDAHACWRQRAIPPTRAGQAARLREPRARIRWQTSAADLRTRLNLEKK